MSEVEKSYMGDIMGQSEASVAILDESLAGRISRS